MPNRILILRCSVFSVALLLASASHAAPTKHKKPGKKPTSSSSAPDTEAKEKSDRVTPAAVDSSLAALPESAPTASDGRALDAPDASPPRAAVASVDVPETPSAAPLSASEARANEHALQLGRREAARIAAGRVEVAVWLAAGVARRTFKYSDPVGQQYAPYHLPVAPMMSLGLEAYPFASSELLVLQDLGFRAHFSKAFAVDSKTPEGVTIATSWTRFGAEARQRLLLPSAHPLELGLAVGADGSYFDMSTTGVVPALLPSARTISVRVGLDARLQLSPRFGLALGAAYLAPTTRGAIYERFRDPQLRGVDGDFAAALGLLPGFEARATARYTRYFASFKPQLGDGLVAGGALDEQFQFGVGVRYAH